MISLHRLPLLAAVAFASAPVLAQDQAAAPKQPAPAETTCAPEHAAMGHCTLPAEQAAPAQAQPGSQAASACTPEHAAMGHCTAPRPSPATKSEPAGPTQPACSPEHAAMGHCTPAATMGAEGTDLAAGSGTAPPVPTDYAADAIYGPSAMASGRHHLSLHHGGQNFFMAILNIAEVKVKNGRDAYEWGGEAWYGGDINRLVVKTEGEGEFGAGVESAEVQALYSRAIGPYFDLQAGVRYDFEPDPSRVYATIGFEGLAPGFFDVEGALFLSDRGELMGRLEGYYDQRITQQLILQPRAELNFAAQNSEDIGVGAGLTDAEIGVRLRYDIAREFAPYIGVQYERAFDGTRDFLRAEGEATGGWNFLGGIRFWF
ncbi:copper resistance protein B (plasmid) [Croceicoccus marinus]|uniref:Copper resistance protein B n=2 Tax=Croceicoccus marinus TaxID=450378 RepID=A0A7G6VYL4_9SPHN|nr:copper resistance protein B [Croceicoccus marinus]QNE06829.1 copper resistance protein B [Croceicoccus marinus]